jgi:hypothetical protein
VDAQKIKGANLESNETQGTQLERVFHFLEDSGIEYYITNEDFDSFLEGIKIEKGKLKINPENLLCVGDILHEAGHLACIPSNLRSMANDNISESMGEEYTYEMGVIAWSVAAALHLDIALSEVFTEKGYKGEAQYLLDQFAAKNYIGLPLLQWMGMAAFEDELVDNEVLPFPKMLRWTRA